MVNKYVINSEACKFKYYILFWVVPFPKSSIFETLPFYFLNDFAIKIENWS